MNDPLVIAGWIMIGIAVVATLVALYFLGYSRGMETYARYEVETEESRVEEVMAELVEVDIEMSTVVNEQASRIMQLEGQLSGLMELYSALKAKFENSERLRRKWHRVYVMNTGILKAFIANPAMTLPRTWRRYQEGLLR